jgi:hypothetical protein
MYLGPGGDGQDYGEQRSPHRHGDLDKTRVERIRSNGGWGGGGTDGKEAGAGYTIHYILYTIYYILYTRHYILYMHTKLL